MRPFFVLSGLLVVGGLLWGQTSSVAPAGQQPPSPQPGQPPAGAQPALPTNSALDRLRPNYVLRPGDQILVRAAEAEEIGERPLRIDAEGYVNMPMLGRMKVGGLSVERLEATLVDMLKKFVRQPQATVTVTQFSSEPIFFVGAFKAPGIYPLEGRRTLVEMMSSIGGLQPNSSRRIKVTRRKEFGEIPLPAAQPTPDGNGQVAQINMASLSENVNPAEDIVLQPFDVISVERAELVYVNGAVGRIGAFELQEKTSISVVQALTLAGGMAPDADPQKAAVLRPISNSSRRAEIPLNLKQILKGKASDFPLLPNDLLYVPRRGGLRGNARTALYILPVAASLIYTVVALTR